MSIRLIFYHPNTATRIRLQPENLLLDSAGNLRISDFGLSALTQQYPPASGGSDDAAAGEPSATANVLRTTCGTPSYCAPEVLLSSVKGYDGAAADMWSCGVILYVLLTGFLPFDDPAMPALFKKIVKAEFQYPEWVSADARSLIDHLLLVDPERRLSCQAVKAHAWLQSGGGLMSPTPKHGSSSSATAFSFQDQHEAFLQVPEPEEGSTGDLCLPTLNAFDIINMVGGTAISRMFQTRAAPGGAQLTPTTPAADTAQTSTQFTSDLPLDVIMERIGDALAHLEAATKIHDRLCKGKFQLERSSSGSSATTPTASVATCAGTFQVYAVTQGVHCVEFIRERGDLLAFDAFYRDLRDLFFAAERAPAFARGLHRQRSTERRERGQSRHLSVDWSASSPNRPAPLPGGLASPVSPQSPGADE